MEGRVDLTPGGVTFLNGLQAGGNLVDTVSDEQSDALCASALSSPHV